MPEIEASHPDMTFVRVNRDDYMALAQTWNIFGIPSFVVTQNGQELGRLVNKARKTKEEVNALSQPHLESLLIPLGKGHVYGLVHRRKKLYMELVRQSQGNQARDIGQRRQAV